MDNRRFYRRVKPMHADSAVLYADAGVDIESDIVDMSEEGIGFSAPMKAKAYLRVGQKYFFSFISTDCGVVTDYVIVKHIHEHNGKLYIGGSCPSKGAVWDYVSRLKCELFQAGHFVIANVS